MMGRGATHRLPTGAARRGGVARFLNIKPRLFRWVRSAGRAFRRWNRGRDRERELLRRLRRAHRHNRVLKRLNAVDGLTGVGNRRNFNHRLGSEWSRGRRGGPPLSLLLIDIDRFKDFNDSRGHWAGDACLRSVARAMSRALNRPGDAVTRYGGEEFAVLLPHTDLNGARAVAERLRRAVCDLHIPRGAGEGWVTVSVGVASVHPNSRIGPASLVTRADRALYRAKAMGRDRVETDPPMTREEPAGFRALSA